MTRDPGDPGGSDSTGRTGRTGHTGHTRHSGHTGPTRNIDAATDRALGLPVDLLDDPKAMRSAGRDLLSLALLDARNHLLPALAAFDAPGTPPGLRQQAWETALRTGAWQARWLLQVEVPAQVQGQAPTQASIQTPNQTPTQAPAQAQTSVPGMPAVHGDAGRAWLAQVLEASLDRLNEVREAADSPALPDTLAPWHQALQHEDRLTEKLAVLLQRTAPPPRSVRAPLWMPAQRWCLGSGAGRLPGVPYSEWGAEDVALPDFEIDAQPVNWQQFAEFAADGGYDRCDLWGEAGWAWLQNQPEARRAPRHVAQLMGGVLVQRGIGQPVSGPGHGPGPQATLQRAAPGQAAMHVSRFEAQAWCRWAGRRLPAEPEWELAAASASHRGFAWGDVHEWVSGSARPWAGAGSAPPGCLDLPPPAGSQGVMRGASFATRRRWHHPKARRYVPPGHDDAFCGFRSCAV